MIIEASRIAIGMLVFGITLISLACTPSPNSGNQNQNRSQNLDHANTNAATKASSACDEPDNIKASKVKEKIIEKMSQKLKNQVESVPGQPYRFKFQVIKSADGNYLEAYFQGDISGDDSLKELSDILNDFQKKGCLLKAYFVPDGTLPINLTDRSVQFEWSACEYPLVACPNGLCADPCPGGPLGTPAPGNSNGSSNSNTNSNVNSNSNAVNMNN